MNGNLLIGGYTYSTTSIATSGAYQTTYAGDIDALIVKFNQSGGRLWGTYFGGTYEEFCYGITLDVGQNIIICGSTNSSTGIATSGTFQTTYAGNTVDAFVEKFNSSGYRTWGTYFGSYGVEYCYGVTTDPLGNILITGASTSSSITSSGAFQATFGGGYDDAFIAKFSPMGARLWSTFYGGSGYDRGISIATDISGNILVTGWTSSASGIASTGAYQTTYGGDDDIFVVSFSPTG